MTALGSGGWFSDDTRNAAGTDLVGSALTHAGKPGTVASAAADLAIAQQISIVNAPAGSTYGTALKIDGTSANTGKSTVSVIDTVTGLGAASLLPTTFTASYQWYDQPNPTVRTLGFRIGVQSAQWSASQSGFTATRSGESSWDLALVYTGSSATNAWITEHVDASTGTWSVSRQAGNAYFGTPPAAKTLAAWSADATWGPILFGAGAKITGVQFGLGSGQRQCLAYVGYLQTSLLNGGGVIEFGAGDMYVAAQASDFQVTLDADSSGTLTTGDIVTWNPTGTLHSHGAVPNLTFGVNAFLTIQQAVNAVQAGRTVYVGAGTYSEQVLVAKSLTLAGANAGVHPVVGATTIRGKKGGGATVAIAASDVTLAGFTITREGNDVADWNDPTLDIAGVAIQGQGITAAVIRDNLVTQMRTGIDIYDSSGHTIRNNVITDNRTGMIFRNQTDNLTVVENAVTNNWTQGIVFLDASGGTNIPVQRAFNCTFSNNNISGNWYGQIVDRQTGGALPAPGANPKNFSGNWFGTATPVVTTNDTTQPGYAAQIPVEFGGTATPPGGQPDIAGPASANFDITPLLTNATDTDLETTTGRGTNGFQGDFSSLVVTAAGTQAGVTGRIQEGLNLLTSVGTLVVLGGTYAGDVDASGQTATLVPGGGTDRIIIDGNLTLGSGDTLPVKLNGVVAGTSCGQWQASGTVTLGGATLSFSGSDVPVPGQVFDLVSDSGLNAIVGTFTGLAEGSVVPNFLGSGLPAQVTYLGGAGNDFTLTVFGATVTADGSLVVATPVSSGSPTDTSSISYSDGNLVFTDYNSTFYAGPGVTVSPDGHTMTVAASTFSGPLVLNGNGGDDVYTLDFSSGDPIPAGGIVVNGGSGNDALKVVGAGLTTVYTPSFGTDGSGVISVGGKTITFTGLEPVDFNVPGGTFTLSLPNNGNVIDIADGTLVDGTTPALEVSGSSGGVGFENARVRGAAIVIDTSGLAGSADTITVTSADIAHTNTSLTINTGNDADDVITVNGTTTFPGTVTLNATTVNLNALVTNAVTGTVATAVHVAAPGRIQEGISVAASTGATVSVGAGTYAESPDTSAKSITLATGSNGTDRVVLNGNLALDSDDALLVRLNGTVAGTSYGQWQASGTVTLGGAALSLIGSDVPVPGQIFDVVQNAGSSAIGGVFNGLAEGAVIPNILGTTLAAQITYLGGTGHDIALSVVGATVTSGGSLVIANPAGGGTTDTSTVTYSGGNLVITDPNNTFYAGPGVTVSPDGHTMTVALSSISGPLVFNGTSGDDLFIFDFSAGNPIPAGGIVVNGGAGNDAMRLVGSSFGAIYAPNLSVNGDGVITIGGKTITFTGLEPVDFNVPGGTFTLSLPSAVNVIDVADGFLTDGITPALEISGTSGGVGFENARVRGAAITIDTSAFTGVDTITVTSADNAHTNTSLTINTGTDAGDSIAVNGAVVFAGPVSLNATTVTVAAAGSVTTTGAGTLAIGADALTVNAAATLSSAASVTFKQNSNGTLIDLGGANAAGTLGLSDAELDVVTTPTLNIGDVNSGAITVSAAITRSSSTAMSLTSGSTIALNHLLNSAGGSVTLNGTSITPAATGTDVSMGATGTLAFGSGDNIALAISGATADSGYTQLNVAGHVNLTGAVLALSGAYVPAVTDSFKLVNNDGVDAITGTFTGLAQGSTFAFNGKIMVIHYDGGDGNDVVLSVLPTLIGVTPPANGTYTQSSLLAFTANYSKPMTVDTTGGTPYIGVNIGGTVRQAVYVGGSGTTDLVFHYTVTGSDVDSDGIVVISPIVLNGGTIKDASSTDGPLAFTSPDTTGVLVNGVVAGQIAFTTGVDPAPGTVPGGASVGTWDSIRSGMVMAASSDALAFRGHLSMLGGVTALNYQGIWKSPDGTTASTYLLARSGSDAPDTGTTNALFDLLPLNPFINDLGQTTFVGFLRVGTGTVPVTDSSNASGIWSEVGTGANGLRLLLRQGEAVTGGTVTLVAPSGWVAVSNPATTAGPGYAAFNVQLDGTSSALLRVAVSTPAGVTNVTPVTLAKQGDVAPGIGAATGGAFDAMYGNSNDPRMDAVGDVAFLGYLQAGGSGIWYDDVAGTLSAVARSGEVAPSLGVETFIGFERPSLAATAGTIAFRGFSSTGKNGVWQGDPTAPGSLSLIAVTGDTSITQPTMGIPAGSHLNSIWSPFSAAGGMVAFRVSLLDGASVETRAIMTDTVGGVLQIIAKAGDAAPGTADTFLSFDHPIIGDSNQVAFSAATATVTGIWEQSSGGGPLSLVLKVGDSITSDGVTKTISAFVVIGTASGDRLNEIKAMTGEGKILVWVLYSTGDTGILLTSPM